MQKTFLSFFILIVSLALTVSCKSDDNEAPPPASILGVWTADTNNSNIVVTQGTGSPVSFDINDIASCFTDNTMEFLEDGSVRNDEGAIKCNDSDPQTTNEATWVLSEDRKTLQLDILDDFDFFGLNFDGNFEVLELSSTRMSLRQSSTQNDVTAEVNLVLLRQ